MSKGIIQDKINQIATETEFEGVTHVEVAELLTLINNDKVDKTEAVAYESGFQGSINPDTLPASGWIPGIYTAEVSGTYNNAGGIVVNLNDGYTGLVFDGENWTSFVLPIDVNGIIPDWSDQETGLQFPKTRIFENFIYRVKPGQTATSADVPGISDKWQILNENVINNDEFVKIWNDPNGNFLFGIKKNGGLQNFTIDNLQLGINLMKFKLDVFEDKNTDYLFLRTDKFGNLLFTIDINGNIWYKNQDQKLDEFKKELKETFDQITSDYISYTIDSKGNLLNYRDKDGKLFENSFEAGFLKINNVDFSKNALTQLQKSLKEVGFSSGKSDKSDVKDVLLPFPTTISYINVDIDYNSLPTVKPTVVPVKFEYWDAEGNYLKKAGTLSVQGDSSSVHPRKGFTLNIVDSTLQFGSMVAKDSYYLKSYYTDAFRGQSIFAYRLFKDIINTRIYPNRVAFYSDYAAPNMYNGTGTLANDMSTGATYVADGFPVAFYCKGQFIGVYCIVQKKDRGNYDMKKGTAKHVWLDGVLNTSTFFGGIINWQAFEVRNPGSLKTMDGTDYDGDNPNEIANSTTKSYIISFSNRMLEVNSQSTTALKKSKFEQYFDLAGIIDYFIFSQMIFNFDGFDKNWQWYTKDGVKWSIGLHDCDNIFGQSWRGTYVYLSQLDEILGLGAGLPTSMMSLYKPEILNRYNQLSTILSASNITSKLKKWLDTITYPMLKADLDKWPETPSYRDSKTNKNYWSIVSDDADIYSTDIPLWDANVNYNVGTKVRVSDGGGFVFIAIQNNSNKIPFLGSYTEYPGHGGFYNSLDRVYKVIEKRKIVFENWLNS